MVLLTPSAHRRRALQKVVLLAAAVAVLYCVDLLYLVGINQLLDRRPSDFWLDGLTNSRAFNRPDSDLGYLRKPHLQMQERYTPESRVFPYRTDADGFRNPPGITQADIVFLGDGYTEAASVPEEATFVRQVGVRTGQTVINLGCGGYSPQQELIVLRRYALRYRPRVIVWVIPEETALIQAEKFARWKQDPMGRQPFLDRYAKRSLFASVIPIGLPHKATTWRKMRLPEGNVIPVCLHFPYVPAASASYPVGWEETAQTIEAGQQLCKAQGITLLIAVLPAQVRVIGKDVLFNGDADRNLWLPGGRTDDSRDFTTMTGKLCQRLGCAFFDLTPAMRREAARNGERVYFTTTDVHLDTGGHNAVAEALSDWLLSQAALKRQERRP
jgi:hypothetical protein